MARPPTAQQQDLPDEERRETGTIWGLAVLVMLMAGACVIWFQWAQRKQLAYERALVHRLRQVERLRDEFLVQTTRELMVPLGGIVSVADTLAENASLSMNEKLSADISFIAGSGRRLVSQLNRMKEMSNLQERELDVRRDEIDLFQLISRVLADCKPLVGGKTISLEQQIDKHIPKVYADKERLSQVLYILVDNAIRHTKRGAVTVHAAPDDGHVVLSVQDTGKGLEVDTLKRIQRFFQKSEGITGLNLEGVGMGLVLARQLVDLHGGILSIQSEQGKGARFSFHLPVMPAALEPPEPVSTLDDISEEEAPEEIHADSGEAHIMLVDDEQVNRKMLGTQLAKAGYRVTSVSNGAQAMELLSRDNIDLVLLDIMMPGMSGYQVCTHMREDFSAYELPIIFLTAKNQVHDLVKAFETGGNDFLSKPVPKSELLTRVRTHLHLAKHSRKQSNLVNRRTDDLKARNRELQSLDEIVKVLNREEEMDSLLNTLVEQGLQLFENTDAGVFFQIQEDDGFRAASYRNTLGADWSDLTLANDILMTGFMPDDHKIAPGVYLAREAPPLEPLAGMKGYLCLVLLYRERINGVLLLGSTRHTNALEDIDPMTAIRLRDHATGAISQAHLLARQKRQSNDLVRTHQRLVTQEKMASLGILTAGVAHEINNPTNFTDVSAQLMGTDLDDFQEFLVTLAGEDADLEVITAIQERFLALRGHLETIQEGTNRIKTIVRDLGAFSRRDENEQKSVRVTDCLRSTINLVRTKYQETAGIECDFRADPEILCWPAQLSQVFMNLIVNACQAIATRINEDGTGGRGKLKVTTDTEDGELSIRFQDNGGGIPPEVMEHIFEPFYTTKPEGEGTGLGLSISYRIIQKHGGTISVDSVAGEGTTFTILLPLTAGAREEV
ncbi:MAG: ATP-binding protein [Acidobacteriota bacterium]|nr:ATP-binding protein [Acidobacteriota bacterium]